MSCIGKPGAQRHAAAITRAGMRRGAGEIRAAVAAGGEDHGVRAVAMQPARGQVERDHAAAGAVLHDEVEREVFDEELGVVLDRLLVQRMQHRVAGAVGRRAGALRRALAVVRGHAAERPLVDAAVVGARERHAVVLELDDRGRRFLAHELDGVLVAEPVRALDGVVEMEAPVVLAHVAERGGDAALRRHRVAARREHLGDAGGRQAGFGKAQRRAQARAAGADHDDVVGVIDEFVVFHAVVQDRASARIAKMPATAAPTCTNVDSSSRVVLAPLPCT